MKSAVKYILTAFSIFILASCGTGNNPVSPKNTGSQLNKAGFVIDNLQYGLELKKESDGSYVHYLNYKLSYHFENTAGTLNGLGIEPEGSAMYLMIGEGGTPVQAGKTVSVQNEYSLGKKFNSGDVIKVSLFVEGRYSGNTNVSLSKSDQFEVNKSTDIIVE